MIAKHIQQRWIFGAALRYGDVAQPIDDVPIHTDGICIGKSGDRFDHHAYDDYGLGQYGHDRCIKLREHYGDLWKWH